MRNRNSGLMLDNRDGSLLDGAVIQQWTGNGPGPQRWLLERANQEIATGESTRWR
ncbi:RICIN domain-containing protein [Massilia sp. CCM 8693]|uniref:RICIN domain-containing protein n=2 Tax=Massilia aquatica TaxID=2609000 RepID=A0ABX0MPZ9_9BURK|nr:RICIN domain-containing protein [Massilia aquatica]